ncbi:MAG: hypothetical protein H7A51_04885 [Akkermansiaceae bacterium]|nr:hypothetical protein [Akkermansiaceae bacterium]
MQYEVFTIPAGGGEETEELNKFLRSHRVVSVDKHLVTEGGQPRWVFCVEYLEGKGGRKRKIDN